MLFWETSASSPRALRSLAARATRAECLVRDDRRGGLVVCEKGEPRGEVAEKQVTQLFAQGRAGPEAGAWVFFVGVWTPRDWRAEFFGWYKCEHGPILLECPEWKGFRFFESPVERGCQFYILHRLSDRRALDSEWRKLSRSTPWFKRLAKNKWFDKPFERVLYRQPRTKQARS